MQKISFGGKEYVRATEIAKKFRYTSDYVGQLCRSKKVDARLVGRNWYVVAESVSAYRKTKHKTQKGVTNQATTQKLTTKVRNKRILKKVEPVIRTKTIRLTTKPRKNQRRSISVEYDIDDTTLVPVLSYAEKQKKSTDKKVIIIEDRPAVEVAVQSQKRNPTKFISEKLPEISLSGKLSVFDHTEANTDLVESYNVKKTKPDDSASTTSLKSGVHKKSSKKGGNDTNHEKGPIDTTKLQKLEQKVDFAPTSIVHRQEKTAFPARAVLFAGLAALIVATLILTTSNELSIFDAEYQKNYKFSPTIVKEIVSFF